MSNVNAAKPLLGYRLALIREVRVISEGMLLEFGADLLHLSQAPTSTSDYEAFFELSQAPTSEYDTFVEWWNRETERAVRDNVQLVVVKAYYGTALSYLKRIEEEEFYGQGEQRTRVRFTTEQKLLDAISNEEPIQLKDDWGDIIETFQSAPTDHSISPVMNRISSPAKLLSPIQNESINNIVVNVSR